MFHLLGDCSNSCVAERGATNPMERPSRKRYFPKIGSISPARSANARLCTEIQRGRPWPHRPASVAFAGPLLRRPQCAARRAASFGTGSTHVPGRPAFCKACRKTTPLIIERGRVQPPASAPSRTLHDAFAPPIYGRSASLSPASWHDAAQKEKRPQQHDPRGRNTAP